MRIAELIQTARGLIFPEPTTNTQVLFEAWQAERLKITPAESARRYARSRKAFVGGHRGRGYRNYNDLSYELMQVFYDDNPTEAMEAYRHHAPMHFLMMLGYPEHTWTASSPLVKHLGPRRTVSILDFGCGLAHKSRSLAAYLKGTGTETELHLADIPTLRKDFLVWVMKHEGFMGSFLDCTLGQRVPPLPAFDVLVATEFFEHVHDPIEYFDRFDEKLSKGGIMLTQVADHHAEFMHVTPNLLKLRRHIAAKGYETLEPYVLYRKT